jgi:chemotaxis protein methyltransferase CheR
MVFHLRDSKRPTKITMTNLPGNPQETNGLVPVRISRTGYQPLFALIQAHTGLRVHDSRFDEIARVVDDVLASMHLTDVNDLLLILNSTTFTDPLWQTFIQAITVGETYFYRDQGQMDALRTYILPQLIADRQKTGSKHLRLWSAGCASGEEPYSLVMLLHELLPDIQNWRITVLGTDINLAFLERAKRGLFRSASFRNETPDYVQKRWFKSTP